MAELAEPARRAGTFDAAWWKAPIWLAELLGRTKSFEDNPLIASRWLNERGLHVGRVRLAHALAARRRQQRAHLILAAEREAFAKNGFILKRDFLPEPTFRRLVDEVKAYRCAAAEMFQGDTMTRKIALDEAALAALPELATMLHSPDWTHRLRYVGAHDVPPVLYIQSILTHAAPGAPPDPQTHLHADTFHPTMKAWLFLNDIEGEVPPFTYVPGSHTLTPARLAWERRMSLAAAASPDDHTRQGSFRIDPGELAALGLPPPVELRVPANTLIVADTFGFHARGPSRARALRVEIWAYGRRKPFLPGWRAPPPSLGKRAVKPDAGAYAPHDGVTAFDPVPRASRPAEAGA